MKQHPEDSLQAHSEAVSKTMLAAGYRMLPVGVDGEFVWALPIQPFGNGIVMYLVAVLRTGNERSAK